MSERYTRLFALQENLYAEDSPVVLAAGALLKDNETGKVLAQLKIKNIGSKAIKAAKVRITPFDTVGKPLGKETEHQYLDLNIERDEAFGQKVAIELPDASTRSFSVAVIEVDFADNSVWTPSGAAWEPLPKQTSLADWLNDAELEKQYELKYGKDCRFALLEVKDVWLCPCGEVNRQGETSCHCCKKLLIHLKAADLETLKEDRDARLAVEAKQREEEERKALEARAAAEARAKKAKKIALIAGPIVALCVVILIVLNTVIIPGRKYNEAVALLNAEQYDEAIAAFEALGDYKDSVKQVETAAAAKQQAEKEAAAKAKEVAYAAAYAEAEALLAEEKPYEAAVAFYALNGYSDARERSFEIWGKITERETVSAGGSDTVGLRADGTVAAAGYNEDVECDVSDWTDIVDISAGVFHTVGLRADGTVVAVGDNGDGQCDVSNWTDIVAVSAGGYHTVGLRADGTVVALWDNYNDQRVVSGWTDIVAVSAGGYHTVGLRADGTVVAAGDNGDGQCDVSDWTDIVAVSAGDFHTVGLRADGTVVAVGFNGDGRSAVSGWTDIVAVSTGVHTVGLRADGTVVAVGNNEDGRCDVSGWTDIKLP